MIRDNRPYNNYRRKANQEWEMAGCARVDGDRADALLHTEKAREYDRLADELAAEKED